MSVAEFRAPFETLPDEDDGTTGVKAIDTLDTLDPEDVTAEIDLSPSFALVFATRVERLATEALGALCDGREEVAATILVQIKNEAAGVAR